jgi:hypothetical protein
MSFEIKGKKPYQSPKLTVYGDLTQMTLGTIGGTGQMDLPHAKPRT